MPSTASRASAARSTYGLPHVGSHRGPPARAERLTYTDSVDIGEIRQRETERALEWLNRHWVGGKICPICGNNSWELAEPSELRSFRGGELYIGGPQSSLIPVMPVVCATCGLTHLFSALKAGIVRPEEYHEDETEIGS